MKPFDLHAHLVRQMVWSKATFGPGARMNGVLDHMQKEIGEVRASGGSLDEWIDLVILSFDGLTRQAWANTGYNSHADEVAEHVLKRLSYKQGKNELRNWPDWRGADPNKAIEHVRGHED